MILPIENVQAGLQPLLMLNTLEFLRCNLFTNHQKSQREQLVYLEEAQRLMYFPQTAAYLEVFTRSSRMFNVGITIISQDIDQFLLDNNGEKNKSGRAIINNCAINVIMKTQASSLDGVRATFKFSREDVQHLVNASVGESLILLDGASLWTTSYNTAGPEAQQLFTTNSTEILNTDLPKAITLAEVDQLLKDLDDEDDNGAGALAKI